MQNSVRRQILDYGSWALELKPRFETPKFFLGSLENRDRSKTAAIYHHRGAASRRTEDGFEAIHRIQRRQTKIRYVVRRASPFAIGLLQVCHLYCLIPISGSHTSQLPPLGTKEYDGIRIQGWDEKRGGPDTGTLLWLACALPESRRDPPSSHLRPPTGYSPTLELPVASSAGGLCSPPLLNCPPKSLRRQRDSLQSRPPYHSLSVVTDSQQLRSYPHSYPSSFPA